MDVMTINHLMAGLGSTHAKLFAEGAITNTPLTPSIESRDNEYLIQKPEQGVELWFQTETEVLAKILFSLISMFDGAALYTGELPSPLTTSMSRIGVRAMFGTPFESKEPIKILRSRGYGGSDTYRMGNFGYPNILLGFQYRNDDRVCSMGFSLINTSHG